MYYISFAQRYCLYNFKHNHEGEELATTLFVYSCPAFELPVRDRMLYASCKQQVSKKINLLTQNVLEDTDGVLRPPLDGGRSTPSVSSREASYATFSLY